MPTRIGQDSPDAGGGAILPSGVMSMVVAPGVWTLWGLKPNSGGWRMLTILSEWRWIGEDTSMGCSEWRLEEQGVPRGAGGKPRLAPAALAAALLALVGSRCLAASDVDPQVPVTVQRRVEEKFAGRFVYPDTTEWQFNSISPYPGGWKVVCGTLNYQNAMRRYVGVKHFFAILDDDSFSTVGIDLDANEDRTGEAAFKMKTLCHLP
jgi:hypothetical protein